MKTRLLQLLVSVSLLLLLVTSCVTIAGQRFSWFHDEAKDTLRLLIHYDGIHEGTGSSDKGAAQLQKFVRDGDILFLDWWAHLEMGPIKEKLKTGNLLEKMVAKTLTSFQVQAAGHYTDPGGRIGGLQIVTVPKVSRFLKNLNKLISAAVLAGQIKNRNTPKSTELQKEAAGEQHTWLALDGHAIRIQLPVHPDEAAKLKANYLSRLHRMAVRLDTAEHKDLTKRIANQIAHAPLSIIQEEEMLTFVFGYKKRPCTIRVTTRDEYNDKLEEDVKKNLPSKLDRKFAAALVHRYQVIAKGEKAVTMPGLFGELLRWGPPEDQIGALLKLADDAKKGYNLPQDTKEETLQKALFAISEFGKDWTRRGLTPPAPKPEDDPDEFCAGWAKWYIQVVGRAPLDE